MVADREMVVVGLQSVLRPSEYDAAVVGVILPAKKSV
jgi:hypothetical protein